MKKMFKLFYLITMFLVAPFALVFTTSLSIRYYLNRPLYRNTITNYFCNDLVISNCNTNIVVKGYEVSRIKYAKVKQNCFLFKTSDVTNSSYSNVLFIVPETYFVTILSEVNSMITKVQYRNKIGYVASDSISVVDFSPVTPTLENITFDIPEDVGTQIRSTPEAEDSSNVIRIIPAGTTGVTYVASVLGAIPTGGSSNVWYYAVYSPISDPTSVYEGYVYSGKTANLTNISSNLEDNAEINNTDDADNEIEGFTINSTIKIVLIILICIPIVLVFVLLVASNRRGKSRSIEKELQKELAQTEKKPSKSKALKNDNATTVAKFDENNHITKIDQLEGKSLSKKDKPYYAKFISEDTSSKNSNPAFPTYEVIDDDDLL